MSKAISRRDFLKVSGAVGAAGLLAACGGRRKHHPQRRLQQRWFYRHFHRCFFRSSFCGRSVF